jgi:hypothetical protein
MHCTGYACWQPALVYVTNHLLETILLSDSFHPSHWVRSAHVPANQKELLNPTAEQALERQPP